MMFFISVINERLPYIWNSNWRRDDYDLQRNVQKKVA